MEPENLQQDPKCSCGYCEECEDASASCPKWANQGECENNPFWMGPNCPLSCQLSLCKGHVNRPGELPSIEKK
eukprot:7010246-Ditylum_brightwellii.AAC.1